MTKHSDSETFCTAPWVHVTLWAGATILPCFPFRPPQGWNKQIEQFDEYINDAQIVELRRALTNGERPATCQNCWDCEASGKKSHRQVYNEEFADFWDDSKITDDYTVTEMPVAFSYKLGNTCNLKCITCLPASSIPLRDEYLNNIEFFQRELPYVYQENPRYAKNPSLGRRIPGLPPVFDYPYQPVFQDWIQRLGPGAKWLEISGGEALIIDPMIDSLKHIAQPELLHFKCVTNATVVTDDLLQTLSTFRKVDVLASVDGIGRLGELIRYPSNWEQVEANILKLKALPNSKITINHVLGAFSVVTLLDILSWCEQHEFGMNFFLLGGHNYLTFDSVKPDIIQQFANQLRAFDTKINQQFKHNVLEVLNGHNYCADLETLRHDFLSKRDQLRGTNLDQLIDI